MTHGEAQRARLLMAAVEEAAAWPACPYPTLRDMIEHASNASEAFSAVCDMAPADVTEEEFGRAEDLAINTVQALVLFLWAKHQITPELARKLGDLL